MAEYRAFPNVPARNLLQGGVEIPLMTRGLDIELVQGDLRALPFPMASFDLVIDFGTCYHVSRPDDACATSRACSPRGASSRTRRG